MADDGGGECVASSLACLTFFNDFLNHGLGTGPPPPFLPPLLGGKTAAAAPVVLPVRPAIKSQLFVWRRMGAWVIGGVSAPSYATFGGCFCCSCCCLCNILIALHNAAEQAATPARPWCLLNVRCTAVFHYF